MTQPHAYIVTSDDAGARLDAMCAKAGLYASRSAAARAIESGQVLVNGIQAQKKQVVAQGDVIGYEPVSNNRPAVLAGEPIPLDIRYEDDDMLVLSKQVGLVCHPSPEHYEGTLVNALINHCGIDHLCVVQGEEDRMGIVHRLDKDTSGLMLAAKTNDAAYGLIQSIQDRAINRHYLTLVHGIVAQDTGYIDAPITRSMKDRTRMAIRDSDVSRRAITTFTVLERFAQDGRDNGYSLLDCKLFTGRTHQIRVHLEYVRHPVVGDPVYTASAPKHSAIESMLTRQFLHSYHLSFDHPITHEGLCFYDNPAADLQPILTALEERSMGKTEAGEEVARQLAAAPYPSVEAFVAASASE